MVVNLLYSSREVVVNKKMAPSFLYSTEWFYFLDPNLIKSMNKEEKSNICTHFSLKARSNCFKESNKQKEHFIRLFAVVRNLPKCSQWEQEDRPKARCTLDVSIEKSHRDFVKRAE